MARPQKRKSNGSSTSLFGRDTCAIIGTRFRELCEKGELAAREVSEALDISEASILAYERGDRRMTADAIKLMADFYGIKASDIWRGI